MKKRNSMTSIKYLYENIETEKKVIEKYKPDILEIPKYISNNLKYNFYDWQKNAFENFLIYQEDHKKEPTHLMFNMATGTGKTLLMASTILYYYNQGYRHFIFFVNQNNIIDKTENNFIDSKHSKYLFKKKIIINDKSIDIKPVKNFSDNPQGIEIKFTSIQKLYNDIHLERENQTTLSDLHKRDIVMLADEAHHLNTSTKNLKSEIDLFNEELKETTNSSIIEKKGWEHTVIDLILKKNGNKKENKNRTQKENKNVLLEFTATIPSLEEVAKKYEDKIIYKFDLKNFLRAGYTKEINLISSTLDKKERILQALLFHWYRHKIAEKNKIANFKPVILFRSRIIEESKTDYEEFLSLTEDLEKKDFDFLKAISNKLAESNDLYQQGKSRTEKVLSFIKNENITLSEIADWIKKNFVEKNVIITNSKEGTKTKEKTDEATEKLLNNLEDKNNHIRAIFTVNRLTEGWDVLNLFDIVRLYQGQNAGGSDKKIQKTTIKEKQLIGRGVRYFPFNYEDKIKNKRKFDNDLNNELRILEELFYYTYEESNYITELKRELKDDGYIPDDKIVKTFALKEDFKNTDFYKKTKIWYNIKEEVKDRKKATLDDIKKEAFEYKIKDLEFTEQEIKLDGEDNVRADGKENPQRTISTTFSKIEKHIFQKAINIKAQKEGLYQFEKLKEELKIKSIAELQDKQFLGNFEIKIIVNDSLKDRSLDDKERYEKIDNKYKLDMTKDFLSKVFNALGKSIITHKGTKFEDKNFSDIFNKPKEKRVDKDYDKELEKEFTSKEWYVLDGFTGTSEEEELIKFIKEKIVNLKEKYEKVYLLRNEEVYKIYNFENGAGFQPDFLLFLKSKNDTLHYQVFIEPKGYKLSQAKDEQRKQDFLKEITEKYGDNKILEAENKKYKLIGLPFYNKAEKELTKKFDKSFDKYILGSVEQ